MTYSKLIIVISYFLSLCVIIPVSEKYVYITNIKSTNNLKCMYHNSFVPLVHFFGDVTFIIRHFPNFLSSIINYKSASRSLVSGLSTTYKTIFLLYITKILCTTDKKPTRPR